MSETEKQGADAINILLSRKNLRLALESLPKEDRDVLLFAILDYADGETPNLQSSFLEMAFRLNIDTVNYGLHNYFRTATNNTYSSYCKEQRKQEQQPKSKEEWFNDRVTPSDLERNRVTPSDLKRLLNINLNISKNKSISENANTNISANESVCCSENNSSVCAADTDFSNAIGTAPTTYGTNAVMEALERNKHKLAENNETSTDIDFFL